MRWSLALSLVLICCGGSDAVHAVESACQHLILTELGVRGAAYVEIYNAGRSGAALEGVVVSVAGSGAARRTELDGRIGAGGYVARSVASLPDDGGTVVLECEGHVVDEVHYDRTAATVLGFDGTIEPDATLNDDPSHWCAQPGSAGGANPACGAPQCRDAAAPQPGELVISEVLRDPGGADADQEWVEFAVTAAHSVVLDGLELEEVGSSTRRFTLVAPPCAVAEAEAYLVLPIGGATVPRLSRGSGLFNDTATMRIRRGEVVIDSATIDCGHEGSSCALVGGVWCEAVVPTPGAENRCDG